MGVFGVDLEAEVALAGLFLTVIAALVTKPWRRLQQPSSTEVHLQTLRRDLEKLEAKVNEIEKSR